MHNTEQFSFVVLGDVNADLTFNVPTYPAEGDDATALGLGWGSGGSALNIATMLARLGGQVRLVSRVGTDPAAAVALQVARAESVDLTLVQTDAAVATGICATMVTPTGERTFFSFRGANARLDPALLPNDALSGCAALIVSAYALLEPPQQTTALAVIERCIEAHIPVVLDMCLPAARISRGVIDTLLPHLWLLALNEPELAALLPDRTINQAVALLLKHGVRHLALKRGSQGCSIADSGLFLDVLPPPVSAVDTNGCGDAFTAGCVWALLQRAELPACATLGNLLGALTATRNGSAEALPQHTEIMTSLDYRLHYLLTQQ